MKEKQGLRFFHELWSELSAPDVFWQLLALALCLVAAAMLARWWHRHSLGQRVPLKMTGSRGLTPLLSLLFLALTREFLEGIVHVKLLEVAMPFLGALLLVRICVHVLRQSFSRALWLADCERWVTAWVWIGLALYLTGLSSPLIHLLEGWSIRLGSQNISLWMVIKGSLVVMISLVLALWFASLMESRLMRVGMDSSLRIVSVRAVKAVLILVALLAGLSLAGIDITALSVFTGALGVGLGLGLQRIASNYVSGFIILLDRSIRLGNVVQLNPDVGGTVSEITTRYTVLRGGGGVEFIVPNELLVANTVYNQSYSDTRVRVALRIGVAYTTAALEPVLRLMEETARANCRVIADPPPCAVLVEFGERSILLEVGFWVVDPQNGLGNVRSEVGLEIWRVFQEKGVAISSLPVAPPIVAAAVPG